MNVFRNLRPVVFALLGTFLLAGCAATKVPILLHPDFKAKKITGITLMPMVDRRPEQDKPMNIDYLYEALTKQLEKKGYTVYRCFEFKMNGTAVDVRDVADMSPEELSVLEPDNDSPRLFMYIEDILDNYMVLAYQYKIETTGSLISKTEKIQLWRDKGVGAHGQGGLISGAFSAWDKKIAIDAAVRDLLLGFPDAETKK